MDTQRKKLLYNFFYLLNLSYKSLPGNCNRTPRARRRCPSPWTPRRRCRSGTCPAPPQARFNQHVRDRITSTLLLLGCNMSSESIIANAR